MFLARAPLEFVRGKRELLNFDLAFLALEQRRTLSATIKPCLLLGCGRNWDGREKSIKAPSLSYLFQTFSIFFVLLSFCNSLTFFVLLGR